jgi:hypothetical protein
MLMTAGISRMMEALTLKLTDKCVKEWSKESNMPRLSADKLVTQDLQLICSMLQEPILMQANALCVDTH